jgi:hypothetical protein
MSPLEMLFWLGALLAATVVLWIFALIILEAIYQGFR